ncbi:MAG: hypothetical protein KDA42_15615 [Planctomycetales bacterium]|nr:hypothetical protein [Planctomycetales bacterium]
MSAAGRLKYAYLAYLSKPRELRSFYRQIRRKKPHRIVELGIRSLDDTLRMLSVAARYQTSRPIEYTAIDLFDARSEDCAPLGLKQAHQVLKSAGVKARLLPGIPSQTLPAVANTLLNTDLLIISQDGADANDPIGPAWFFVPRMLCPESTALRRIERCDAEGNITLTLDPVDSADIAKHAVPQRRRAA